MKDHLLKCVKLYTYFYEQIFSAYLDTRGTFLFNDEGKQLSRNNKYRYVPVSVVKYKFFFQPILPFQKISSIILLTKEEG